MKWKCPHGLCISHLRNRDFVMMRDNCNTLDLICSGVRLATDGRLVADVAAIIRVYRTRGGTQFHAIFRLGYRALCRLYARRCRKIEGPLKKNAKTLNDIAVAVSRWVRLSVRVISATLFPCWSKSGFRVCRSPTECDTSAKNGKCGGRKGRRALMILTRTMHQMFEAAGSK